MDDYAEVWINGQMPRRSGYPSPATIQGLNMPNRVVLADAVKAGDNSRSRCSHQRTDLGRAVEFRLVPRGHDFHRWHDFYK